MHEINVEKIHEEIWMLRWTIWIDNEIGGIS